MLTVSTDHQDSSKPLCSIADTALDVMSSLADVDLLMTPDSNLHPLYGIHYGKTSKLFPLNSKANLSDSIVTKTLFKFSDKVGRSHSLPDCDDNIFFINIPTVHI